MNTAIIFNSFIPPVLFFLEWEKYMLWKSSIMFTPSWVCHFPSICPIRLIEWPLIMIARVETMNISECVISLCLPPAWKYSRNQEFTDIFKHPVPISCSNNASAANTAFSYRSRSKLSILSPGGKNSEGWFVMNTLSCIFTETHM